MYNQKMHIITLCTKNNIKEIEIGNIEIIDETFFDFPYVLDKTNKAYNEEEYKIFQKVFKDFNENYKKFSNTNKNIMFLNKADLDYDDYKLFQQSFMNSEKQMKNPMSELKANQQKLDNIIYENISFAIKEQDNGEIENYAEYKLLQDVLVKMNTMYKNNNIQRQYELSTTKIKTNQITSNISNINQKN